MHRAVRCFCHAWSCFASNSKHSVFTKYCLCLPQGRVRLAQAQHVICFAPVNTACQGTRLCVSLGCQRQALTDKESGMFQGGEGLGAQHPADVCGLLWAPLPHVLLQQHGCLDLQGEEPIVCFCLTVHTQPRHSTNSHITAHWAA